MANLENSSRFGDIPDHYIKNIKSRVVLRQIALYATIFKYY
jgi:hypothetical protein